MSHIKRVPMIFMYIVYTPPESKIGTGRVTFLLFENFALKTRLYSRD